MDFFVIFLIIVFVITIVFAFKEKEKRKKELEKKQFIKESEKSFIKTYDIMNDKQLYHDVNNKMIISDKPIFLTTHERRIADVLINSGYFLPQFVFVDSYFRTNNGRTTQIDIIAVGKRGVFVIESKDYSGWIYGSNKYEKWKQRFRNGDNYYFYNPIKQNMGHINVLRNIIGEQKYISMIVFSQNAELKDISFVPKDTYVVVDNRLSDVFADLAKEEDEVLSQEQILSICKKINLARIEPNDDLRNEHIKQIKDELGSDRVYK